MSGQPSSKKRPTVLITDSRETERGQRPNIFQRPNTRLISVDNVLQYASEVPSGQRRGPAPSRPQTAAHPRGPGARPSLDPRLSGRMMQQHMPSRSSKVSEKLVLLPEAEEDSEKALDEDDESITGPPKDWDDKLQKPTSLKQKSYAERLPKASRTDKLSRVTAYCTAQAYKMRATADFVRTKHGAKTKLYDDCLYTVYHLPLLPGNEGYRVRSSPVLKSPGGKAVLDEEIERNERHEYREGYFGEEQYGVRGHESPIHDQLLEGQTHIGSPQERRQSDDEPPATQGEPSPPAPIDRVMSHLANTISKFAEMFIYSYGVVVFWNFTERQEKDILADLTFSSTFPTSIPASHSDEDSITVVNTALAIRPQNEEDFETEEFHFEYNPSIPRPRLFNDMITLRSGDHMIKLSMSHAIAQSTKLSFFEERMADTMDAASYVPRRLALTGKLGMKREEVVRMLGRLFVSRVDVNLSSNMLDTPTFFWDSEPTLHPLYTAVREYLEIKPRIQVLNERCRVFLDLAEILSDSIADRRMSGLTWTIIVLIVLSILVTASEVFLRFGIITKSGKGEDGAAGAGLNNMPGVWGVPSGRFYGGVADL